jgi:uncharacterized membrane protein
LELRRNNTVLEPGRGEPGDLFNLLVENEMETVAKYVFALCVVVAAVMMVAPGLTHALPADSARGIMVFLALGLVVSVVVLGIFKTKKRRAIEASMLYLAAED